MAAPKKWHEMYADAGDKHPIARILRREWVEWNRAVHRERRRLRRRALLAVLGRRCGICGRRIRSLRDLHIDHIVPLARGGSSARENLQAAHALCNQQKGAR